MKNVTSKDGTSIAFEQIGNGPPLILVDGALCYRGMGPSGPLAKVLADTFTVYTYDRRGRGMSGDTAPFSVEREIEDIEALIGEAGGSAFVYGISSGAAFALEAAKSGLAIKKLALYEAPFIIDGTRTPVPDDFRETLIEKISAGRRSEAVKLFMKAVGVPSIFIALMPLMPAWSKLKAAAHTLPYDFAILDGYQAGKPLPSQRWDAIKTPTLVMDGGKSPEWMRNAMTALADAIPGANLQTLPGQTHMLKPKAIAPALSAFFLG